MLILNADFRPLSVVDKFQAFLLIWRGDCVEAVESRTLKIKGVSTVYELSDVLRLRKFVQVPKLNATWSRQAVLARDKYTCGYCGVSPGARVTKNNRSVVVQRSDMTIDHIHPVSRGGKSTFTNTITSCRWCNNLKGDRFNHELNWNLLWEPKVPRVDYLVLDGNVPEHWKIYFHQKQT